MLEISSELRACQRPVLIVLSDELVRHPEATLRTLCLALNVPFDPVMLTWPVGPKPYDGVWAPWWYGNTHKGTGFSSGVQDTRAPMPDHLKPLLGECQVMFALLKR